jgi:RNA polymerase primary sigma factor
VSTAVTAGPPDREHLIRSARAFWEEVSRHDLLTAEQERAIARRIRECEIALWGGLLGYSPAVRPLLEYLRVPLGDRSFPLQRKLLAAARPIRGGSARATLRRLHRLSAVAHKAAVRMRIVDPDKILLSEAVDLVDSAAAGDDSCPTQLRRAAATARFRRYADFVRSQARDLAAEKGRMIAANFRLVAAVARPYERQEMPLLDLIQEGNIGLIRAVERFDERRGCRFSTFAIWWIRHHVRRGLADRGRLVRIPVHALETRRKLESPYGMLLENPPRAGGGRRKRTPSEPERPAAPHVALAAPVSLDAPVGPEDSPPFLDLLCADERSDPSGLFEIREQSGRLENALASLSPRESAILRLRFGIGANCVEQGLTLREVGERFGVSRERIRQIEAVLLKRLRCVLETDSQPDGPGTECRDPWATTTTRPSRRHDSSSSGPAAR